MYFVIRLVVHLLLSIAHSALPLGNRISPSLPPKFVFALHIAVKRSVTDLRKLWRTGRTHIDLVGEHGQGTWDGGHVDKGDPGCPRGPAEMPVSVLVCA
jgi:hypothetical protein